MKSRVCNWLVGTTVLGLCAFSASALTVRVDPANGAPRLVVNGKPVRARMFFGNPEPGAISLTSTWQRVEFEFQASASATDATMHFRFGQQPGDVFLDNIRVIDRETREEMFPESKFESGMEGFAHNWTSWPPGKENTVAQITIEPGAGVDGSSALHVKLTSPSDGKWPDFHIYHQPRLRLVQGRVYQVSFHARANTLRSLTVAFYDPARSYRFLGGPPGVFDNQVQMAHAAGVDFVSFPIDMPWPQPGVAPDWSAVDATCQSVLRTNPKALLLPRMGMDPPDWWRKAHPDDVMLREDGSAGEGAVVASPLYRKDAAERLAALVSHLEEKFGDHVAGYHPCGQNTGEWFYHQTWGSVLSGFAPGDVTAWRMWLAKRYETDAALQRAWAKNDVVVTNAPAPTATQRHASPNGVFRDPAVEQSLIDWAEFQQESMAECVCTLAKAIRQASGGRKLAVFFYGYVFEFGPNPTSPAVSGHYALRRVLNCPDVDVLCSPISYFDRGLGQSAPAMTAAESVALSGKMWLFEDDTHTYLASESFPGSADHVDSVEKTRNELVRNVAEEAMRNFGTWWMDLGGSGWFNDAHLWSDMERLKVLDNEFLAHPRPFQPEVAAIIDPKAILRLAPAGTAITGSGVYEARRPLARMGAPYGQYLLDDVLAGRVRSKLYVFLTAWSLSHEERVQLLNVTSGGTRVWCYAPGYLDTGTASLEAMRELTGFSYKRVSPAKAWATPTEAGRRLGILDAFGSAGAITPLFAVADAKPEEILATYPDGSTAIALRQTADGVSMFVGVPGLTSDMLRLAAQNAKVHLFTRTDCNVYANGPFLSLHGAQDGALQLDTGRVGEVTDLFTGQVVGHGPAFSLPLKLGETQILRIKEQRQ